MFFASFDAAMHSSIWSSASLTRMLLCVFRLDPLVLMSGFFPLTI